MLDHSLKYPNNEDYLVLNIIKLILKQRKLTLTKLMNFVSNF